MKRPFLVIAAAVISGGILLLLLSDSSSLPSTEPKPDRHWAARVPTARLKQDDQVRDEIDASAAVARYAMSKGDSNRSLVLSVDQQDPPDDFLRRFAQLGIPAKKASQANAHHDGTFLRIDAFIWIAPWEAIVMGGDENLQRLCGGLCIDDGAYDLVKQDGKWRVLSFKMLDWYASTPAP